MILFRFMSGEEFALHQSGAVVSGRMQGANYSHSANRKLVCFMPVDEDDDAARAAELAYEYMSGIVSAEVCAVFESEMRHEEGEGRYADPYGSFFDTTYVCEAYVAEYSIATHRLVRFCKPAGLGESWTWKDV